MGLGYCTTEESALVGMCCRYVFSVKEGDCGENNDHYLGLRPQRNMSNEPSAPTETYDQLDNSNETTSAYTGPQLDYDDMS